MLTPYKILLKSASDDYKRARRKSPKARATSTPAAGVESRNSVAFKCARKKIRGSAPFFRARFAHESGMNFPPVEIACGLSFRMGLKGEKLNENRFKKYFKKPLDTFGASAYSPPPVAVLKGIVTSERIGERMW
ncbi:MAG TPA: hypothetical protein VEX60_12960 [Pyrinomonadaceae bacterium]|nr:hypothetical protein [Pyrinomonadaceae bacterium]